MQMMPVHPSRQRPIEDAQKDYTPEAKNADRFDCLVHIPVTVTCAQPK